VGLADLTAMTGIPKPTVRRIAEDLARRGALARTPYGYQIGATLRGLTTPRLADTGLALVHEGLTELRECVGGVAWYVEHHDQPRAQPTIALSSGSLRTQVVTAWPDPTRLETLTSTALGHATLAVRPDLLERVERAVPRAASGTVPDLSSTIARARDRGAFFDDARAVQGWRCVAVDLELRIGGVLSPGLLGVSVPGTRRTSRDLIALTQRIAQTLAARVQGHAVRDATHEIGRAPASAVTRAGSLSDTVMFPSSVVPTYRRVPGTRVSKLSPRGDRIDGDPS
jgi:DNA-binding IclR family transcriptional regulator